MRRTIGRKQGTFDAVRSQPHGRVAAVHGTSREGLELWDEMKRRGVLDRTAMIFAQMKEAPGARLIATQSAEQRLEERTARLRRHLTAARREASTQEVIEIAAGARARNRTAQRGAAPGLHRRARR